MKLLCKKDYIQGSDNDIFVYRSGNSYVVDSIQNDFYVIRSDYYDVEFIFCSIHKNVADGYLYDYFYTNEEIRKMKLKSLC